MHKIKYNIQAGTDYSDDQSDLFETESDAIDAADAFLNDEYYDGDEIRVTALWVDENGQSVYTERVNVIRECRN